MRRLLPVLGSVVKEEKGFCARGRFASEMLL